MLEVTNAKIGNIVSDTFGVSGQAMVSVLLSGEEIWSNMPYHGVSVAGIFGPNAASARIERTPFKCDYKGQSVIVLEKPDSGGNGDVLKLLNCVLGRRVAGSGISSSFSGKGRQNDQSESREYAHGNRVSDTGIGKQPLWKPFVCSVYRSRSARN